MTSTATMSTEALVASLRAIADHSFDSIMITRAGVVTPTPQYARSEGAILGNHLLQGQILREPL